MLALYDRVVDPALLVRRLNLTACHVEAEAAAARREAAAACQLDLFTDYAAEQRREEAERQAEDREKHISTPCWTSRKSTAKTRS